jgi:hypothetical protein
MFVNAPVLTSHAEWGGVEDSASYIAYTAVVS